MSLIQIVLPENIQFAIEGFKQEADYITSCMSKFNNWEPNLSEKFVSILKQAKKNNVHGIVLDIGSCFGYYSLITGQSGFKSIAFEPNPETLAILKRNVELSGQKRVLIREVGLGDTSEMKTIRIASDNIGGSSLAAADPGESGQIEIKRLDDESITEHVIICKIDVEGYEPAVIKGGLETIRKTRTEFIFLEVSSKFCDAGKLTDEAIVPLWNEGYLSFDVGLQDSGKMEEAIKTFRPFSRAEEVREYLKGIEQTNFLFVRKKPSGGNSLTGELWKDELILNWTLESAEEKGKEISNLTAKLEDERKENSKLFGQLNDAAEFQQGLLTAIQEKDKTIAELESKRLKLLEGIESIRHITEKVIT